MQSRSVFQLGGLKRAALGGVAAVGIVGLGAMAVVAGTSPALGWQVVGLPAVAVAVTGWLAAYWITRRQRTLERERDLMVEAFEGAPVARIVCDADDRPVYVSRDFPKMVPMASESALEALRRRYGTSQDKLARIQRMANHGRAGHGEVAEFPVFDPATNNMMWHQVRTRPLPNWPGYVYWRIEDVTDQHEIAERLQRDQERLSDFMDNAPIGVYSVDQNGHFLFTNKTLADWLQTTPDILTGSGKTLRDILVDAATSAPYDITAEGGLHQSGEVTLHGLLGRTFQAAITQSVVIEEDGSVRTRSVVRDLSPEREWQEALRVSEQRFQRFFEDAPIGIALVNASGSVLECNDAFAALTGQKAETLPKRQIAELLVPEDREKLEAKMKSALTEGGIPAPIELRVQGPETTTSVQLFARRMGSGDDASLILHFIDLTEQKSLEAQFSQSQKMQAVGQLAGGVAHDFNNLLTAMIGFCDLLLLRHKPGDHSFSDIMQIKQNANRAANLVRQLLAFSRQQTLQPRVLNLTDVLAELSNLLRRLIGENIELKMIHGRDLGPVLVDQGQLEQVIINLAVNARDAMSNGGQLTIQTSNLSLSETIRRGHEEMPPGDYVCVDVSDTGVGIPPENLQRIFEPFFSTKEVGSGTGLGLSTVYGIVRQTGGFVFVESAPGHGAKFTICLPRHQAEVEATPDNIAIAESKERTAGDLTGVGNILLVEDEDAVRVFSARALRNKGYQVLEAKSGEAALQLLAVDGASIDLLITDVVMPQMDGPTLIKHVRQTRPDLKVIFISGYTEDRFRQYVDEGEIHFLPKPFSLKQLAAKVKDVMRGAEDDETSV